MKGYSTIDSLPEKLPETNSWNPLHYLSTQLQLWKLKRFRDTEMGMSVIEMNDCEEKEKIQLITSVHQSDETLMLKSATINEDKVVEEISLKKDEQIPWYIKSKGLLYIVVSTVLFCTMGICVKALSKYEESIPLLELVVIRGIFGFLVSISMMWYYKVEHYFGPPEHLYLLFVRGFTGFAALACNFFALNALSLGDATVLGFLAPLFTGLMASFYLNEEWEKIDALAGFFAMVGIMFIARPSFIFGSNDNNLDSVLLPGEMGIPGAVYESDQPPPNALPVDKLGDENLHIAGILAGVLGALFVACALISIRKLSNKVHSFHVVSYFHWVAVPCALFLAPLLPYWIDPKPWILPVRIETWLLISAVVGSGVLGQICLSKGMQTEKASKAASMNYIQIVFAFLGEWLVWGVVPNFMSLLGAFIVIASIGTITWYKVSKAK